MSKSEQGQLPSYKGGSPVHVPTDESRAEVRALSGFGITQDDIARYLDIAPKTLRKHYRDELDTGTTHANAEVARSLHKQATEGGNVAAAIFWMKARAGWREKQEVELSGPGGGPVVTVDAGKLSDAALKELLSARAATDAG